MNLRKIWKPPADSLVSAGIYVCYRHRKRLGKKKDEQGTTEIFDYDRSKLILSTLHSSLNGPELVGILLKKISFGS